MSVSDWRKKEDEDHRYSITVYLIRDKRPKYWEFHCAFCGTKVCDLDGTLISMSDLSHNSEDANNSVVRIRCPGSSKWCRLWYEFQLQ